jgi:hypothetical protein
MRWRSVNASALKVSETFYHNFCSRFLANGFGQAKQTACRFKPVGRSVDCLGLTKRWSLYVASHGNSRVWDSRLGGNAPHRSPDATNAELHPYSPVSVRAVAPGAY